MTHKIFNDLSEISRRLSAESSLSARYFHSTAIEKDLLDNISSGDRTDGILKYMKRSEMKAFHQKVVTKLREEITYDTIKTKYTHMHSKPFTYDPAVYGQFAMESNCVQNRLINIFGGHVMRLQDPQYTQKCLKIHREWLDKQESLKAEKRVLNDQTIDAKNALMQLVMRERTKIEKQLTRFKNLKTNTKMSRLHTKEFFTSGPTLTQHQSAVEKRTCSYYKPRSHSPVKKIKCGKLTLTTNQPLLIRTEDITEVDKLFDEANAIMSKESQLFPKKYLRLRRRKEKEVNEQVKDEPKGSTFSTKLKKKFLATFKVTDKKEAGQCSSDNFLDFSNDVSQSLFID